MIRVENLKKSFKTKEGGVEALAGINFEVRSEWMRLPLDLYSDASQPGLIVDQPR